jgi:hypothetical protein
MIRKTIPTVTAAAAMFVAGAVMAAPAANATTDPVPSPATGRTAVTTQPGIAKALVNAGVLPYSVSPGRTDKVRLYPASVTYSFPITGLTGGTFAGNIPNEITHAGGIAFVKLGSFSKRIVVSDFTIDLNGGKAVGQEDSPQLIGTVKDGPGGVPDGARVALFDIDLSNAKIDSKDVQVTGAALKLTGVAAGALNAELGTSLFSKGLNVFSARANA